MAKNKFDRYPFQRPAEGDICVRPTTGADNVWIIERRVPNNDPKSSWTWEQIATEKSHYTAVELTRRIARESGSQAWIYNLENQYEKL